MSLTIDAKYWPEPGISMCGHLSSEQSGWRGEPPPVLPLVTVSLNHCPAECSQVACGAAAVHILAVCGHQAN